MGSFDGKINSAHGKAWIVDANTQAKLKVSFNFFMGLFGGGDYWIIRLADDYSYSVVSEPKGRFLWILSRSPQMDANLYLSLVEDLKDEGFLVEYLQKTPQAL
jgi:apolipoprotein D and lipocalin family protein